MPVTRDQLLTFLSAHLAAHISGIEPVGLGEWSQTYFFTANGQRKVIRFSAYDEDFLKDRFAARFSGPHMPIPPIEEIGEAFGLFYAISPYIEGKMIDHLSAAEMRETVPALLELLNALREVDGSQTQGYGGFDAEGNGTAPSWRASLTSQHDDAPDSRLDGWRARLASSPNVDRLHQAAYQHMLSLLPLIPEERHLIHNDLLHFNLITQDQRVAGVIDWGCALWGDFLYDLALITAWQFAYPAMAGIDFIEAAREHFTRQGVELPNYQERLCCYQIHLLLDGLVYNAWKGDPHNLELTANRLREVLMRSIEESRATRSEGQRPAGAIP